MRCECGNSKNWIELSNNLSHFWKCKKCGMVGHEYLKEKDSVRTQIFLSRQQIRFIDWKRSQIKPKPTRSQMIRTYIDLGIIKDSLNDWLTFRKNEEQFKGRKQNIK